MLWCLSLQHYNPFTAWSHSRRISNPPVNIAKNRFFLSNYASKMVVLHWFLPRMSTIRIGGGGVDCRRLCASSKVQRCVWRLFPTGGAPPSGRDPEQRSSQFYGTHYKCVMSSTFRYIDLCEQFAFPISARRCTINPSTTDCGGTNYRAVPGAVSVVYTWTTFARLSRLSSICSVMAMTHTTCGANRHVLHGQNSACTV